ncbi:hypothetical protein EYF80_052592 [Liparis tanakae]|uniref:Uncharacterized protein n=1 Tax=Liparis tanakae TaxID=230148 RepID=A0A4Z2F7R1_9TELE|nr:hypothetical protein EYF80_052592 [Liparis tanakae]
MPLQIGAHQGPGRSRLPLTGGGGVSGDGVAAILFSRSSSAAVEVWWSAGLTGTSLVSLNEARPALTCGRVSQEAFAQRHEALMPQGQRLLHQQPGRVPEQTGHLRRREGRRATGVELLLCELHVQQVLEDQSVTQHGVLHAQDE